MLRRALALASLVACGGEVAGAKDASPEAAIVDTGLVLPDASPVTDATVSPAEYFAYALLGGTDRILVYKKDVARDLCFTIRIMEPSQASGGLSLPPPWGLELAGVSHGAAACGPGPMNLAPAQSQTGSIAFTPTSQSQYPTTLDVDVTLTFAAGSPPWVPATEKLGAVGVPVTMK